MLSDLYMALPNDTSNAWVSLFRKINDEFNRGATYDGNVQYGMAMAYTTVQALKAAGKNLTRGGLVEAVEKGGFEGPGMVPFRFSEDDHSGYGGVRIAKISKGEPAFVGPIYVTDDSDAAPKEQDSQEGEPPSSGVPD